MWLTWPVLLSLLTIVGGGVTSGGRALWVFAANEKVSGLTIPAAGVGILALGLYTYFLITRPSVLAGIGAAVLAVAFGLLSFYYCGFQSLFGQPMHGLAAFVMALLPETCMVLGGVVCGLAVKAARAEQAERERKAREQEQSQQESGWRLLEQENERRRLLNEREGLRVKRLELQAQAGVLQLTTTTKQTKQLVIQQSTERASERVRALLAQAQANGINVLAFSERLLAKEMSTRLSLDCKPATARQVIRLAKGEIH
jgi:hypothetical protein